MPKRILIRNSSGRAVTIENTAGGQISSFVFMAAPCKSDITITDTDLDCLYNSFVKPFIAESPFYMGSIDLLTTIYSHILTLLGASPPPSPKSQLVLEIFRDFLTILLQARDIYFNNTSLTNQVNTLRAKYQLSAQQILFLTEELAICRADENTNLPAFSGSLGIVLNKPKNLIYAQALLNTPLAWYYFLHNTKVIEPRLYAGTIQYVNMMGTKKEAYNKLKVLLDDKYLQLF